MTAAASDGWTERRRFVRSAVADVFTRNRQTGWASWCRHFAAMDVPLGSVGVAVSTRPEAHEKLAPYQSALDLPIVRALANPDAASLTAVADTAAP